MTYYIRIGCCLTVTKQQLDSIILVRRGLGLPAPQSGQGSFPFVAGEESAEQLRLGRARRRL